MRRILDNFEIQLYTSLIKILIYWDDFLEIFLEIPHWLLYDFVVAVAVLICLLYYKNDGMNLFKVHAIYYG